MRRTTARTAGRSRVRAGPRGRAHGTAAGPPRGRPGAAPGAGGVGLPAGLAPAGGDRAARVRAPRRAAGPRRRRRGGRPALAAHTALTGLAGGKFENVNRLLEHAGGAGGHDWLLVVDDDVDLPPPLPRPLRGGVRAAGPRPGPARPDAAEPRRMAGHPAPALLAGAAHPVRGDRPAHRVLRPLRRRAHPVPRSCASAGGWTTTGARWRASAAGAWAWWTPCPCATSRSRWPPPTPTPRRSRRDASSSPAGST